MTDYLVLFVITGIISLIMLICSLIKGKYDYIFRGITVGMFALQLSVGYFGYQTLTGTPRDSDTVTMNRYHGDREVKGFYFLPDVGIYVLIDVNNNTGAAMYLYLPWTEDLQDKLQNAAMKAAKQGSPLMVNMDQLRKGLFGGGSGEGDPSDGPEGQSAQGGPPAGFLGPESNRVSQGPAGQGGLDDRNPVFHPAPQPPSPEKTPYRVTTMPQAPITSEAYQVSPQAGPRGGPGGELPDDANRRNRVAH